MVGKAPRLYLNLPPYQPTNHASRRARALPGVGPMQYHYWCVRGMRGPYRTAPSSAQATAHFFNIFFFFISKVKVEFWSDLTGTLRSDLVNE